jgi:hypothetical protein
MPGESESTTQTRSRRAGAGAGRPGRQRQVSASTNGHAAVRVQHNGDGGGEKITIELSKSQVDQVVRGAGAGGTMSILLTALRAPDWTLSVDSEAYPEQMDDRRLSRSLLAGLLVLSCFPVDGGYLGIAELARMLDMNTSTTHRYVTTLLAVGLIERDPATRRYRIASA